MKHTPALVFLAAIGAAVAAHAQSRTDGERPPLAQQVVATPPSLAPTDAGQKLYAPENRSIVAPEQARAVVDKFAEAYGKLGKPRLLFYVNRDLVDASSGLRLTKRSERTEADRGETKSDVDAAAQPTNAPQVQVNVNSGSQPGTVVAAGRGTTTSTKEHVSAENTYESSGATKEALADKQTVRDVERLFGRPFRAAGAQLADQRVAAALIADKPFDHFTASGNEQARKDREALAKVADIVIEVLISSREILLPKVSGDTTTVIPDIQATAIRLSDSAIVGQASSRDVIGKDRDAGRIVSRFDVQDIAEATALALMEDMALGGK
ncbi:MAG: hypothetical protein HZA32_11105 [Opitutae bacterium]|nr:hypothetical protein [Opitutae bacterium]